MANQMIALGVRGPQVPDLSRVIAQTAQMSNMMMQQRAAERQAAQAQQRMDIEARLAEPQFAKAQSEAQGASIKAAMDFNNFVYTGLSNANDPATAAMIAERIAAQPQFSDPLFQGAIADAIKTMPQDPAEFAEWRDATLAKTMDTNQRLERDYIQQNLGTSTRVISAPKFGRGPAEVLPGSEATVNLKPTVVNVEGLGPVIVDPNTGRGYPAGAGATGGYTSPGLVTGTRGGGGGGGGSVAAALQTNPGALKDGPFARSQPGYAGSSGGFATFNTPQAGIAAQENLLRSAYIGKGFNTIDKIVNRYAPPGPENSAASVSNYKNYVAQRTGLDINAPISPAQVSAVAAAMREFETGNRPGGKPGAAPAGQNIQQAASAAEKQRKVKTFQNLTGVNLETGEDPVAKLIRGSTSGAIEAFGANLMGAIPEQFGGGATPGMENIGKLEALASTLTLEFAPGGRLSTGVSNEDRAKIEQQLGKIEDPNIPAGKRLAAWQEVKAIMARTIGVTMKSAPTDADGRPKPTPADVAGVRRNRDKREWTEGFRRQFGDEALRKALGGR